MVNGDIRETYSDGLEYRVESLQLDKFQPDRPFLLQQDGQDLARVLLVAIVCVLLCNPLQQPRQQLGVIDDLNREWRNERKQILEYAENIVHACPVGFLVLFV